MKNKIILTSIALLTCLLSTNASASNFPGICENTKMYDDNAVIIQAPAAVGGCVGNIAGGVVGGVVGIFYGKPVEVGYVFGLFGNAAGNTIFGAPGKFVKSVFWDYPKKAGKKGGNKF